MNNRHMSRREMYLVQLGLCFYCEGPMPIVGQKTVQNRHKAPTVDHLWPRSSWPMLPLAKVFCHQQCNQRKGSRQPTDAEIDKFNRIYPHRTQHDNSV